MNLIRKGGSNMVLHDAAKRIEPVVSLIKSENSVEWQLTYLPCNARNEFRGVEEPCVGALDERQSPRELSDTIIQEYNWVKDLSDAENGIVNLCPELAYAQVLLRELVKYYRFGEAGRSKHFVLKCTSEPIFLETDTTLFRRVIGEMLMNALEASGDHETVKLTCAPAGDEVEITVHNEGGIPPTHHENIFHHSFSTKGEGRGRGTYYIKLLGEKYLGGKVYFNTSQCEGTKFGLRLPRVRLGETTETPEDEQRELVYVNRRMAIH